MVTRDQLLLMNGRQLNAALEAGHPIDPAAIAEWEYRGVAVGSRIVEKLAWKTFKKTFHRDGQSGVLRGWNIRIEQTGSVDGEYRPMVRDGEEFTWGFYRVTPAAGVRMPYRCQHGLLIDYGYAENGRLHPQGFMQDPLLAVNPGNADLLIGVTYLQLGLVQVRTPTWFVLSRDCPLRRVVASRASAG